MSCEHSIEMFEPRLSCVVQLKKMSIIVRTKLYIDQQNCTEISVSSEINVPSLDYHLTNDFIMIINVLDHVTMTYSPQM